jgi:hypothetical protein
MKPGFHSLTKSQYFADPCPKPSLTASIAHLLVTECPSKAWAAHPKGLGLRDDPTEAMERGSAVEQLLGIGDTDLVSLPHQLPDAKGNLVDTNDALHLRSAKEWKADAERSGKQVVKRSDLENWTKAAAEIKANLWKRYRFEFKGRPQRTIIWESNGVWCRGKLDHEDVPLIDDLKICETANPDAFAYKLDKFGYDIQSAAYLDGVATILPEYAGLLALRFIVCEPHPPYEVVMYRPDGEARALGDLKWSRAKKIWGDCLDSGDFYGYARENQILETSVKPWSVAKAMEDQQDEAA